MNVWRKATTGLVLGVALASAWFVGNGMFSNASFAQAQDQVDATRQQLQNIQDIAAVYKAVGRAVEPSVVSIDVTKTMRNSLNMRRFFPDRNGDGQPDVPDGFDMPDDEVAGTGSGVIVATDGNTGYIVTNNHVAGGANEMEVSLWDGRVIKNAKLVGADAKSDIAVIKIEADKLIPAKWGNSEMLEKGDIVMAFGSPFGYVGSMTHGIVSALHRNSVGIIESKYRYENFIQTDAPINPGNSGGPLVNLKGEVVGINAAIASRSGGFQGIGFAIPANQAKAVYEAIKTHGKMVRGWLGVEIADVTNVPDEVAAVGYTGSDGVLVKSVFRKTPVTGKLRPGDVVTAIDGKKIAKVDDLRNTIAATEPGKDVKLTVVRENKPMDVTVKVGEQPDENAVAALAEEGAAPQRGSTSQSLGMHLEAVTPDLARTYELDSGQRGAIVTSMRNGSPAMRSGLRVGDVITSVNDTAVTSPSEFDDAMAKADLNKGVKFNVENRDGSRMVFVKPTTQK